MKGDEVKKNSVQKPRPKKVVTYPFKKELEEMTVCCENLEQDLKEEREIRDSVTKQLYESESAREYAESEARQASENGALSMQRNLELANANKCMLDQHVVLAELIKPDFGYHPESAVENAVALIKKMDAGLKALYDENKEQAELLRSKDELNDSIYRKLDNMKLGWLPYLSSGILCGAVLFAVLQELSRHFHLIN